MSEAVIDTVYSAAVPGICSWDSCRCNGGSRAIGDNRVKGNKNNDVLMGNDYLVGAAVVGVSVGMAVGMSVVTVTTFLIRFPLYSEI